MTTIQKVIGWLLLGASIALTLAWLAVLFTVRPTGSVWVVLILIEPIIPAALLYGGLHGLRKEKCTYFPIALYVLTVILGAAAFVWNQPSEELM